MRLRPPDDRPIEQKVGYWHAVEMRRIRKNLVEEGFSGTALYFEAVRCHAVRHANDLSLRVRQEVARASRPERAFADPFRLALEAIRDGDNDPRSLARRVLEAVEIEEKPAK